MYYEINVSLNGKHYFATAERSLTDKETAVNMAIHFKFLFPEKDGYLVDLKSTEKTWKEVNY